MKRTFITLTLVLGLLLLAAGTVFYLDPLWIADQQIRLHLRSQHVRSEYVNVDGFTVHYFEAYPAHSVDNGQPLVLIHGLGSRAEDWSGMIPTLAANGFHVYALDLLGYGRSTRPDIQYTITEQEKLVADFMQAIHLTRSDVGGWSMGGWVALKLTVDHPSLVRRLIVYDAAGLYFPTTFDASLFTPVDAAGLVRLQEMLSPHPTHLPGFVVRAVIRRLQDNAWILQRSVGSMTGGRDLLDFQVHRIKVPTLVVWGEQDKLIPLSSGEQMHRKIANSSLLVVAGCGHLAPSECTRPVLRGSIDFLSAHPPTRGGEETVPGH